MVGQLRGQFFYFFSQWKSDTLEGDPDFTSTIVGRHKRMVLARKSGVVEVIIGVG